MMAAPPPPSFCSFITWLISLVIIMLCYITVECWVIKYLKYVCTAMRFVVPWGIELKLGRKNPWQKCNGLTGSKVIQGSDGVNQGQIAHEFPMATKLILVGRNPDRSVVHCWGHRSCRDQPGSNRGQVAQECSTATKFGRNPWPKCSAMMRSKVVWGQMGANRRSVCLEMPS